MLEEKISGGICGDFAAREERILGFIEKLNEGGSEFGALLEQVREELSEEWSYAIQHSEPAQKSFADSYELKISSVKAEKEFDFGNPESTINQLQEHLDKLHESMVAA